MLFVLRLSMEFTRDCRGERKREILLVCSRRVYCCKGYWWWEFSRCIGWIPAMKHCWQSTEPFKYWFLKGGIELPVKYYCLALNCMDITSMFAWMGLEINGAKAIAVYRCAIMHTPRVIVDSEANDYLPRKNVSAQTSQGFVPEMLFACWDFIIGLHHQTWAWAWATSSE